MKIILFLIEINDRIEKKNIDMINFDVLKIFNENVLLNPMKQENSFSYQ